MQIPDEKNCNGTGRIQILSVLKIFLHDSFRNLLKISPTVFMAVLIVLLILNTNPDIPLTYYSNGALKIKNQLNVFSNRKSFRSCKAVPSLKWVRSERKYYEGEKVCFSIYDSSTQPRRRRCKKNHDS